MKQTTPYKEATMTNEEPEPQPHPTIEQMFVSIMSIQAINTKIDRLEKYLERTLILTNRLKDDYDALHAVCRSQQKEIYEIKQFIDLFGRKKP